MTSGGSLDCTISDVVAGGAQDFFGGLLDPSDEVPAEGATLLNNLFHHQISQLTKIEDIFCLYRVTTVV